jgi:hypothetical protein
VSNLSIIVLSWVAAAAHVVVGILAWRRPAFRSLVPTVNLVVALCVLGYWARRWYDYVVNGTTWYLTDQSVPLYALAVCLLSAMALTGRYRGALPNALVFALDGLVLLAAALFFSVFRINRLF